MQTLEALSIKIVSQARLEKDISLNQVKFTLEITIDLVKVVVTLR